MTRGRAEAFRGGEGAVPSVSEVASAYLDGEVGDDQAAWVAANRPVLAADLTGFARLKEVLGGLERVQADPAAWDAISGGVRKGVAAQRRRVLVARVSGVAAAIVLAFGVAFGAVRLDGPATDVAAPPPTASPDPVTSSGIGPSSPATAGTGAVAAARGIGSVVERVGVAPRRRSTTSSTITSTRAPVVTAFPDR